MANLPLLGNMETTNLVTAYAAEQLLKPFRRAAGDVQSLPDIMGQLVGIRAVSTLTDPLINALNPKNWMPTKASLEKDIPMVSEEQANSSLREALNDGFVLLNNTFEKMHETMKELLFVTHSSMTKAAKARVMDERKRFLEMETNDEALKREEEQTELLKKISESSQEEAEKGFLEKFLEMFKILLGVELVAKMTGIFAGTVGLLNKVLFAIPGIIGFGGKGIMRLLGPAGAAFNIYNTIENSKTYTEKWGNQSSFLGMDTSRVTAGIGGLLGGEGEGIDNAKNQAISGAIQGAGIGMIFGPAGALVGAIIGGLTSAIAGYFGGEKVTKMFDSVVNTASEMLMGVYDGFKNGFQSILGWIEDIRGFLTDIGKTIVSGFVFLKDGAMHIYSKLQEGIEWIQNFSFVDLISDTFSSISDSISNLFSSLKDTVYEYIYDMLDSLGSVGQSLAKNVLPDSFLAKKEGQEQPVESNAIRIYDSFKESSIPKPNVEGIKNTASEMLMNFNEAIKENYQKAKEEMKKQNENSKPVIVPIPVQKPVIIPSQESTPLLIAPRPMRNPNFGNFQNSTKYME